MINTQVYTNPQGQLSLDWQVNTSLLAEEERRDGRYLLAAIPGGKEMIKW